MNDDTFHYLPYDLDALTAAAKAMLEADGKEVNSLSVYHAVAAERKKQLANFRKSLAKVPEAEVVQKKKAVELVLVDDEPVTVTDKKE